MGNTGAGEMMRVSENKAPLVPIFLKAEKKVAVTSNYLTSLTAIPRKIFQNTASGGRFVSISKGKKQS